MGKLKQRADTFQRSRPWLSFPYAVIKKFGEDRAGQQAALLAYYGFFSLFPLLLAAITILGIVLRDNPELQDEILGSALSQFPVIGDQIRENVRGLSASGTALVIGLAGALYGGLAGVKALQNAMDHVWHVPVRRQPNVIKLVLRGLLMLVILGGFTLIATGLAGTGAQGDSVPIWARVFTFPLSMLVNVAVFLAAFKLLTEADVSWRDVFPGALLAGLAWTALQAIGNYYVGTRLRNASEVYGFFGVVIGLLSWLYLAAQITLLCAEINVVKKKRFWPRSLETKPETDADERALRSRAKVEERVEGETIDVAFDRHAS